MTYSHTCKSCLKMCHTNEQYCREHKPSKIFEGENSSLRKTYDKAVKNEPIKDQWIDVSTWKNIGEKYGYFNFFERKNIGMLRQWLNEDRITDPKRMITNEDIIKFLTNK